MDFLTEPWPWYITGPMLGLMVPLLLFFGGKRFGVSSSLRDFCATCIRTNEYFKLDLKKRRWSFALVIGMIIGGLIASEYMWNPQPVDISEETKLHLKEEGVDNFETLAPLDIFSFKNILSLQGFLIMILGGMFVGFGTRWANGCTSGHGIMGMAMLNPGSLVAVIGFFIGGLLSTYFLLPHILSL